ncbi:MAG TPA: hypothetical protein PKA41_15600, partial [Verrucomicrobiota bacterium]|nr:hypothetical protein [Verrucomicrobiota bacterium]
MKRFFLIGCLLGSVAVASSAELDAVSGAAKTDLQQALEELTATRKQIEEERLPLAQQLRELEQKVLDDRRELDRAQRFQENQLVELNALKSEVKRRHDEIKFLEALLAEYLRAFETRVHISEVARLQGAIDSAKSAAASAEMTEAQKIEKQAALLSASLDRLQNVIGGETFAGKALSPKGKLETGKYALIGPMALFASDESDAAGVAELQLGSPEPTVLALPSEFNAAIKEIASKGSGP